VKLLKGIEGMGFFRFFFPQIDGKLYLSPMHLQLNKHACFSKKIVKSFLTPKHFALDKHTSLNVERKLVDQHDYNNFTHPQTLKKGNNYMLGVQS